MESNVRKRNVLILRAILALTGCVSLINDRANGRQASNGVVVQVKGDGFDGTLNYVAPTVVFDTTSFFNVAADTKNGQPTGSIFVVGEVNYRGDWRYYHAAQFRGGETALARFPDKEVES